MIFVGIDWARSNHHVTVLDKQGCELLSMRVEHEPSALQQLAAQLEQLQSEPSQVRVCIEHHNGALLDWLLEQGYAVYALNPKSAERGRERYRASGAKDDRMDAFTLADTIRTDAGYLRQLQRPIELNQQLKSWLVLRADLVEQKTAQAQRLRCLLAEWCPALSHLCGDFDRIWQRDLLAQFPLQCDLAAADQAALEAFCSRQPFRKATRKRLMQAAAASSLPIAAGRVEALRWQVRHLVKAIGELVTQLAEVENRLQQLIQQHPDTELVQSLPISGPRTAAALLAGFGTQQLVNWRELAARWGVAPVTKQSGKSRYAIRRRACDKFMCQTLMFFAFNTAQVKGCWARQYYQDKRDQGTDHFTALRCLAQRWLKVLSAMWRDGVPYDEQLHQDNRRQHAA